MATADAAAIIRQFAAPGNLYKHLSNVPKHNRGGKLLALAICLHIKILRKDITLIQIDLEILGGQGKIFPPTIETLNFVKGINPLAPLETDRIVIKIKIEMTCTDNQQEAGKSIR